MQERSSGKWALVGWLTLCFAVPVLSSIFSAKAIPTWYAGLAKPSFNPPNHLFGPIWTVLYTLMGIAAWMVWKQPSSRQRTLALTWFCLQLVLNFLWSFLFFYRHGLQAALGEILALWAAILVAMLLFFRVRRPAGWMLVPYLAWVSFASVLNWEILRLN